MWSFLQTCSFNMWFFFHLAWLNCQIFQNCIPFCNWITFHRMTFMHPFADWYLCCLTIYPWFGETNDAGNLFVCFLAIYQLVLVQTNKDEHRLDGLKNKNWFLTVLEVRTSKSKVKSMVFPDNGLLWIAYMMDRKFSQTTWSVLLQGSVAILAC